MNFDFIAVHNLLQELQGHADSAEEELVRLRARVAELENPFELTDEHKAARKELALYLNRAADSLTGTPGDISHLVGLLLGTFAGNLLHDAHLSPMLCRRAEKLAAALLGEDTDRA